MVRSDSYLDDTSMVEVAGNRLVWKHIHKENQRMILDPLGYDPIKDVDELMCRNRRRTDGENADYKRWKDNPAERR